MISLGKYSYAVNPNIVWNVDESNVICGNFSSIGANVTIFLGNGIGHDANFVTTYPFGEIHKNVFTDVKNNSKNTNGSVKIGNDVWIGQGSTIMSGVTIGDGAIIAANSHVVKSVEPYSIVGGNPAKHIKYRFSPEQIKNLLEIKWWDWSENRINKYMNLMLSNDIDKFIKTSLSDENYYFLLDDVNYSLIDETVFFSTDEYNKNALIDVTDDSFIDEVDSSLNEIVENSDVIDSSLNEIVENSDVIDSSLNEIVENSDVIDSSLNEILENSGVENNDHVFTHENCSDQPSINETGQHFPVYHDPEIIQDIKELIDDIIIYIEA
jgi:acetyltransferase-like isoleucine patch superfamily enzyme